MSLKFLLRMTELGRIVNRGHYQFESRLASGKD
jgi:hypothetical protein